jgi:hypothetical protein
VPDRTHDLVAILYEHSLLGEGVARIVRAETGVEVAIAPARDRQAVEAILADDPGVVIFECCQGLCERELARLVPHAVLIDVSAAMSTGTAAPESTMKLDRIILAIRDGCGGGATPAR